jgi:hypothetical protein
VKLHEIAKRQDPHAKIKKWLDQQEIKNYTIRPDGIVDVEGNVNLRGRNLTTLPVQFGKVTGYFNCKHTTLTSWYGVPQYIGNDFMIWDTHIISLSGVDKIIKHIDGRFVCNEASTHILGLLLIKGITNIDINPSVDKIMNKYIGTGDILSAQDELIDAGFTDQARL